MLDLRLLDLRCDARDAARFLAIVLAQAAALPRPTLH